MNLKLPALDEAYHHENRKPSALLGPFAFLSLIVGLVQTQVLPVPRWPMTITLGAFASMILFTTLVFHRWGFHSLQYRIALLLETLTLLSGFAVSMAGDPPGLPILWAFYLLMCVVTAQDVGVHPVALGVVLTPVLALLVYQSVAYGFAEPRHYYYSISGGLLAAALYLFFGKNRQSQVELMQRQIETERQLGEARMNLEAQQRMRELDENWLSVLSQITSALVLVDEQLDVVAIRHGGASALDMKAEINAGLLSEWRHDFEEAAVSGEPVVRYGVALPSRMGHVDLTIVSLPKGQRQERYAVLVQDATARVRMEEENRQLAQQMILADKLGSVGLLAAGVAHEVNNPLSYVMGNVEYLSKVEPLSETARSSLSDIDQGLKQIASIVGDLRGFSYNSSYSYRNSADLVEIVQRASRLVSAEIRQHAVFRVDVPRTPVYVRCRAERIQQVIVNLLINASQSLPEAPSLQNQITISLEASETEVAIHVSDTGMGMSEDVQKKVFDLFFTTKPPGKGTGLGLSIAYNIARDHNGSLTVKSAPGEGTTFTLTLPRTAARTNSLRILVVDDEERTLALYSKALENFHVTTATSVAGALSLLANDYDAILCDIRLSDGSGFDLYEQAPAAMQGRFVFYTALPPETPELKERPAGQTILHKPINLQQIETELNAVATRKA